MHFRKYIHASFFPLLLLLTVTSCKEDKSASYLEKINELEKQILVLEGDNKLLDSKLDSESTKMLREKIVSLETEIERLKGVETKYNVSEKLVAELEERLKQKAAEAEKPEGVASVPAPETQALPDNQDGTKLEYTNAVVIIEGDESTGTGFIVKIDDRNYLYTASHVLSGNKKLTAKTPQGVKLQKFGTLEAAEGADLVRLPILEDVTHALELLSPDVELPIQEEIGALGNGGGTGVISLEKGHVLGVSADSLEVSTAVIPGNSGGPVIQIKTGKVVGVVTHLTAQKSTIWTQGTRQAEVRRFACRLNKEWKWKEIKISQFLEEGKMIEEYNKVNLLCASAYMCLGRVSAYMPSPMPESPFGPRGNQMRMVNRLQPDKLLEDNASVAPVSSLLRLRDELNERKMAMGSIDFQKKINAIYGEFLYYAKNTKDSLKVDSYSWFHAQKAKEAIEFREECITHFGAKSGSR